MHLVRGGRRRDVRVDFFRGLAIWWIFADHMPKNVLSNFTLHDFAVSDAAEIFVVLAGYASAKAYAGAMDKYGWRYGAADAVRRAGTIYVAHIFLFVLYAVEVAYFSTDQNGLLADFDLTSLGKSPYPALLHALSLQYQPNLLNILPLYVVLLLTFAGTMRLLRHPNLLLGLSGLLYMAAYWWRLNLPGWSGTGWYFDPLAWQFLFAIGAVIGYSPPPRPYRAAIIDAMAAGVLAIGFVMAVFVEPRAYSLSWAQTGLVHAFLGLDKTFLDPSRILSVLAMVWLAARFVPADARWLKSRVAGLFEIMGQHSLPVFCLGVILTLFGQLALSATDAVWMQVFVNAAGTLAMLGVAALAAWQGEPGRSQRPILSPATAQSEAVVNELIRSAAFGSHGEQEAAPLSYQNAELSKRL